MEDLRRVAVLIADRPVVAEVRIDEAAWSRVQQRINMVVFDTDQQLHVPERP